MGTNDIRDIDFYAAAQPFLEVYPNFNTMKLPTWVIKNISKARVYGNKKRCVILPDGRKYHLDNKLNDLTGKEWTLFINSVFHTHYSTKGSESYAHEIRKVHPSPKPPQLMKELISFFTKEEEIVFDAFVGVGGTLLGAALAKRKAFGFDLNEAYLHAYQRAAKSLNLEVFKTFCGDSLELLNDNRLMNSILNNSKISLMLIDPPYSNMMSKPKTGGDVEVYGNVATPFTNDSNDLGNMNRQNFLEALRTSVELTLPYIKKEGYVVIFIKDLQPNKKDINFLHAEVVNELNKIPKLYFKGMKIWADTSTKLYPYGYPFSFVANQIHQYILIFRNEK